MSANRQGTPQGGVISPLLANLYLHWFDKVFHSQDGPAQLGQGPAGAVCRRLRGDGALPGASELVDFMESKLEGWMGLKINREKTRVVNLREGKSSLDFLGYTFRYDRDLHGQDRTAT